jgi:hypothetical protein
LQLSAGALIAIISDKLGTKLDAMNHTLTQIEKKALRDRKPPRIRRLAVRMTAKHRVAVEALKAWAIEANQNDPEGLALACQALDAAFGDHDAEAQAFFTMLEQTAP